MIHITLDDVVKNNKAIVDVLHKGELVIFPSDTVYGLLVDAKNPVAVDKLLQFKERPPGKPVSVFCSSLEMISSACEVSEKQLKMLNEVLPGKYTVVLPSKQFLVQKLESEKKTLGVRIPAYKPVVDLVAAFGNPITATSANLSGQNPHYSIESLLKSLPESKKNLIGAIVDAGKLPRNKPSTVIDLSAETVEVLRVGDTLLNESYSVISKSEPETRELAVHLIRQFEFTKKPVVFILKGDLGSGKTVFTKGLAEYFNVEDVVSPTYVIYYEYDLSGITFKKLYHFDLYNIQEQDEFNYLGIDKLLISGNVLVFEWGDKLGSLYESFKNDAEVVFIEMTHLDNTKRKLTIHRTQ